VTAPRFDRVAAVVQRLAVLTTAGVSPVSAWHHLAEADADAANGSGVPVSPVVQIASGLASAHDLPHRIAAAARDGPEAERSAWGSLAAIWGIATQSGAALGPALERSADVLRSLAQSARDVEVALAGPLATSRIVLALPAVGVLLGILLGFDVIGAFASLPGVVCLAAGGILIVVAVRWNRRLLRWARDLDATPGLGFDLLAIALSGGTSVERAQEVVASACAEAGIDPPADDVRAVLAFAVSAGVPVVGLLRAESDERRREARAAAAGRAARLETRLLLPLGLCVLPAFVLLGVGPIALAILSSTVVQL
jgi:tight adherence protein B